MRASGSKRPIPACVIPKRPKMIGVKEVDTKFYDLEKFEDPDVRYYACVVDKNRAGAKPKLLFRLNLAYNSWEELGYLRIKQ